MKRAGLAVLAGLAVIGAAPAKDRKANCGLIRAFAVEGTTSLRGMTIKPNAGGLLDVRYRKQATPLINASDCQIGAPDHNFRLYCQWNRNGDLEAARREQGRLKAALEGCLDGGFKPNSEGLYKFPAMEVMERQDGRTIAAT